MTRRNKLEQVYDVLTACMTSQRLTHILNLTNLNYQYAKPIIDSLIEHGLLEVVEMDKAGRGSATGYVTTDEGTQYLLEIRDHYKKLKGLR